ncbi:MAG: DNA polymerase III subunit chi [Methylophilaceae bacterium]|nr:DNA polymerase III subunit chi [Methylophilaceae bacterium]
MTRVDFYFNVDDKLQKTSELTQKALYKLRKVMVCVADETQATKLSNALWCDTPSSFLPNCLVNKPFTAESVLELTPIVITSLQDEHLNQDDVLINLKTQHSVFFSRFRQLIELVGSDEADKGAARLRFKFYRDRGYQIKTVDDNAVK